MKERNRYIVMQSNLTIIPINTNNHEFSNYSYIILDECSSTCVIIDPAWEKEKYETIIALKEIKNVEAIILTHSHIDHINLADYFSKKYKVNIYLSKEEVEHYNVSLDKIATLQNGEIIKINNMNIYSYLLPGHTKGSMCYQIENNVFTGDTLFNEGCGYCTDYIGGTIDMYNSLQFIKQNFDLQTKIYPGHVYLYDVGQSLDDILQYNMSLMMDQQSFTTYQSRIKKLR
jgi:hydroxyacylglutathione hydrolase